MKYYSDTEKKIKQAIVVALLLIVLLIIYVIIIYASRIGKIPIKIKYAPFNAIVIIDGEKIQNNTEQYITPGEHTVDVSLDNFDPLEQKVILSEDSKYLFGYLYPNTADGEKIREEHVKDYQEIESISSYVANMVGEKERTQKPILKHLPFKNSLFSIGYTYDESDNFIVTIQSSNTYLSSALEKLKEFDSVENLSKYNIQITNFNSTLNPFINNDQTDPQKYLEQGFSNYSSIQKGSQIGDYYYTNITTGSQDEYNLLLYKILLKKEKSSWELIGSPYPFLTIYNTDSSVPLEVIVEANNYN